MWCRCREGKKIFRGIQRLGTVLKGCSERCEVMYVGLCSCSDQDSSNPCMAKKKKKHIQISPGNLFCVVPADAWTQVTSSFSASMNGWFEDMAPKACRGNDGPTSAKLIMLEQDTAEMVNNSHFYLKYSTSQDVKLWLVFPGLTVGIRLLQSSMHQGWWILIWYLFYCCWNKQFISREESLIS